MKKIIIGAIALLALSCSKDEIKPKDKRNDCIDCTATIKNSGGVVQLEINSSFDYTNTSNPLLKCTTCTDYCDYLVKIKNQLEENTFFVDVSCK